MRLQFTKMQGCGNDYIYFNCFEQNIPSPEELSILLSDRHFGIGGDGIVLICPSQVADAKMSMFNLDGSEGKMCGNAIRCVAKYLYDREMVRKLEMTIETLSGIKTLTLQTKNNLVYKVSVDMGKAELESVNIPVDLPEKQICDYPLTIGQSEYRITCVSMGNPHCVVFCDEVDEMDIATIGKQFEKHSIFPAQVNTEFIKVIDENTLQMRVWERGSGETLACGTGACAAVVAAVLNGHCKKGEDVRVKLTGGDLLINYTDERVIMTGAAETVFEGEIDINFNIWR